MPLSKFGTAALSVFTLLSRYFSSKFHRIFTEIWSYRHFALSTMYIILMVYRLPETTAVPEPLISEDSKCQTRVGVSLLTQSFLAGTQVVRHTSISRYSSIFRLTVHHDDVIKVHVNGTLNSTGYYTGGHVAHVGQMFFDETLLSTVSKQTPYSSNTQTVTAESSDNIFQQAGSDALMPYYYVSQVVYNDDVIFQYSRKKDFLKFEILTCDRSIRATSLRAWSHT